MDNREMLAVPLISTEKNLFCYHHHPAIEVNIVFVSFILNMGYCHYHCYLIKLKYDRIARETQSYSWRTSHSGIKYKTIKPFRTRSAHWLIIRPVLRTFGWILWLFTLEQGNSCLCTPEQREQKLIPCLKIRSGVFFWPIRTPCSFLVV